MVKINSDVVFVFIQTMLEKIVSQKKLFYLQIKIFP